MKKKIW